jgi:hypothetical protein
MALKVPSCPTFTSSAHQEPIAVFNGAGFVITKQTTIVKPVLNCFFSTKILKELFDFLRYLQLISTNCCRSFERVDLNLIRIYSLITGLVREAMQK